LEHASFGLRPIALVEVGLNFQYFRCFKSNLWLFELEFELIFCDSEILL